MQARNEGGRGVGLEPAPAGMPAWLPWLQLAISTTLAVLFVVVLARSREQSRQLGVLQQRVQGLETSRALDRTGLLEQQLRSTVERLQSLEGEQRRLGELLREQAEQGLQRQRQERSAAAADGGGTPAPPAPPLPPPAAEAGAPGAAAGVLRPPSAVAPESP